MFLSGQYHIRLPAILSVAPNSSHFLATILAASYWSILFSSTADPMFPVLLNDTNVPSSNCEVAGTIGCPSESWQSLNAWFRLLASFMDSDGNRKPRMMPVKAADCIALMAVILRNTNSLTNITVASMPAMPLASALQKTVKLWDTAATLSRVSDKTTF